MIRSSFASFTTARLAIQASQNALAIVGQNMANVKTEGYTRQRLDQISLNSKGITSIHQANPDAHIGYGVMVTGISQIRDPFLDARYRAEMGNLGAVDKKVDILTKLGEALDETDRTAWKNQITDLENQLKTLSTKISDSNDALVQSSAQTLVGIFNQYANQLSGIKKDVVDDTDENITKVNELLTQIKELNVSIKDSQVHGNDALELQDARNQLIDSLSTYVDIRVTHSSDITMTGNAVDNLRIDMVGNSALGSSEVINLIDDVKEPAQFSIIHDSADGTYSMTVTDTSTVPHKEVFSSKGTLGTAFTMLNESGEFGDPPTLNRGIGYYQKSLDCLANKFAEVMNGLNVVYDKDDPTIKTEYPLFASKDPSDPTITAANITLASGWLNNEYNIVAQQRPGDVSETTENSNILNMISALSNKQQFSTPNDTTAFSGSFFDYFNHISNSQAVEKKAADSVLDNYLSITTQIANSKDSVSGVSLDEEGMNMMQFNSSLTAASRLMTTLDEALNTIINSMGVVGR